MIGKLPYAGIRIVELNATLLSGRLAGLLFADQGAEVVILDSGSQNGTKQTDGDEGSEKAVNDFLNRNKIRPTKYTEEEQTKLLKGADVIIVDGEREVEREAHQTVLHIVAALPGDKVFGHLPHDCDEGILLALTGFFTDMALSWFLERPVIYTPLKICSIYAGVIGADATAAALIDRTRNGNKGRVIHASRLAAGLSAIGALSLNISGPALPKHLESVKISHFRRGITKEEMEGHIKEATNDPAKQLWLEQRLFPFGSPYHSKDGSFILPMATFNKRMARNICNHLGIWEDLQAKCGVVDADPYVKENDKHRHNNLALPMNFGWNVSSAIAEMLSNVFKAKTAIEWEREMSSSGVACVRIESFKDWMSMEDTRKAKLSVRVEGCDSGKRSN
jgi:crotonobetainyl-CoA:carnitine CoA-transferase CaiB-like acyl-CoA transferase